ncbi:Nucleoporin [Lachnellula occidentalis]|uniref:Nucleoporin n=1 Tax=Lachnellula occidentalis TaxID=215460 RepID=A0A8H8S8I8_9HELO|nr:Nucleoporin [Lachnellula occidentalis]
MSFGGGFGGGGFGQNNTNTQPPSTGFGFGAANTNTNTGGFGSTGNTGGFGSTNNNAAAGGIFGGGSTGGFGSSGGGAFGSGSGGFGAKPGGFGTPASSSGSIFGGGTSTAGTTSAFGGGFGSTANNASTSSPFGGGSGTTGGLFGANKPAFGGAATTSNSPFGGGANTTPAFGGSATTGGFGSPAATTLGGPVGECQGTGAVPFQPFVEKEPNSTTNQQNAFQSISFQQPYQKFSPEELRLADYAQGRKNGNASGQAGAFGASTGFGGSFGGGNTTGGFGSTPSTNTGGGLFGQGATSSPFGGGTSQPSTGFGANTATAGGGLFGANKPAPGLFGASQPAQTGGIFGSAPATGGFGAPQPSTGGFGATNTNAGSNLFGANNNTANKSTFSFGTSQPAAASTGFGAPATGGAFGSGGGGLFGNPAQQPSTASPFGGAQQQPAAATPFGGGFGSTPQQQTGGTSLFGGASNQPKPAGGLFGTPAASTGGGLFGGAQSTPNTNPFGGSANTQNSGGLFGGAKPNTTSTGLFGATNNTQTNTGGGGLFGGSFGSQNQNQNQQQQSTGLFGGLNNNNQQKPGGLFSQPQQQGGSSLFGGSGTQQPGNSLFGGNNSQQQQPAPQNSLFGSSSLFNSPQQGQQTPQSLTASITDNAAYGGASLFSGLASTQVQNPGPIATPLSSSVRQKKTAALPLYKLNSASTSRYATPQKRGYGFSYSNYTTPGSASSTSSTPGAFSGSMLGGRSLKTSLSSSSLRRSFGPEDSILAPGAFAASPSYRQFGSTGNIKKLNINRSLRNDLFSPPNPSQPATPSILKKKVSFDAPANGNGGSSPLKDIVNGASPSSEDLGLIRPSPNSNGVKAPAVTSVSEMEQVRGNELAIVHEEEASVSAPSKPATEPVSQEDQKLGPYWMEPSKAEIENMSRAQRSSFTNFKIGRSGVGVIEFNDPVDLNAIDLDSLFDSIVILETRSATVYPVSGKKPPVGKGLNVPSTISLENSWPRKKEKTSTLDKNSTKIRKHTDRLKKVPDTKFISYDSHKGIWTFTVPHFTTYDCPEDDDDETDGDGMSEFGQSTLSAPPDTPTPMSNQADQSFASTSQVTHTESDPEDTFEFKRKKILPGAFDEQEAFMDDEMEEENDDQYQESFLGERSVGSQSEDGVEEPMDQDDVFQDGESVNIVDQDIAGSYPQLDNTAELVEDSQDDDDHMEMEAETPGALARARLRAVQKSETPSKGTFAAGNDWTAALRTTISPQKQDRALLKSLMNVRDTDYQGDSQPTPVPKRVLSDGRGFATSIDLMNSLFGQTKSPSKIAKVPAKGKGFEWPYAKRPKTADTSMSDMSDADLLFHDSMRPGWGPDGTLVYAAPPSTKPFDRSSRRARERNGILAVQKAAIVSENRDIRFAKFSNEASAEFLKKQKAITIIEHDDEGVPFARFSEDFTLSSFYDDREVRDPASKHEKLVWMLASVLWDPLDADPKKFPGVKNVERRLRKDNLSDFWHKLVDGASAQHVALAKSNEEKAIACLSGHKVADACGHLINGKNFHLATLVALIGGQDSSRKDIREQLSEWQKSRILSEISEPVRALYELLAGNVCICNGTKGVAAEDRIESFVISKRFGLDWRQAFGLRLWYGTSADDDFSIAIETFAGELAQDKETAWPLAWYVEEKIPAIWEDKNRNGRDDLLWGLLKLHTFNDVPLEEALCPENSQLSPLDFRLMWQLSQALTSLGVVSFQDESKADEITLSFAAQLTNEGNWLDAIFVLLHLVAIESKEKAVKDQLGRFAGLIGSEDSQSFVTLTQVYKIEPDWVWEAKALYMRSVEKNRRAEVECLVRAKSFNEAHRTFIKDVAPKSVVELDHDTLRELLQGFKGKENMISEWHLGGQIYLDFLELADGEKKSRKVDGQVLERLLAGLPAVVEESRRPDFMERVAVETISATVAQVVVARSKEKDKSNINLSKILQLPLTEDNYLKHTVGLSLEYYRNAMVAR